MDSFIFRDINMLLYERKNNFTYKENKYMTKISKLLTNIMLGIGFVALVVVVVLLAFVLLLYTINNNPMLGFAIVIVIGAILMSYLTEE